MSHPSHPKSGQQPVYLPAEAVNKPVKLDPFALSAPLPTDSFTDLTLVCKATDFEDIFYVSGSNCFWLIEKRGFKLLKKMVTEFDSKVLQQSNKLTGLSAQDINLDMLLVSPSVEHFFTAEQKQEWQRLATALEENDPVRAAKIPMTAERRAQIKSEMEQHTPSSTLAGLPDDWLANRPDPAKMAQAHTVSRQIADEMATLKAQGIAQAKKEGYEVDNNGRFFDPRQVKIKAELKNYLTARTAFINTSPPQEQLAELRGRIKDINEIVKRYCQTLSCGAPAVLADLNNKLTKMNEAVKPLYDSVTRLAELGIAVPEWALAVAEGEGDIEVGMATYAQWFTYQAEKARAEAELEKVLHAFLVAVDKAYSSSSDSQSLPPREAFKAPLAAIERAEAKATRLYELAVTSCDSQVPKRVLVWDGEYEPRPLDTLTKGDYPLREICSAALSDQRFSYFSLYQIGSQDVQAMAGHLLKLDNDPILERLLQPWGITRLPFAPHWFDKKSYTLRFEQVEQTLKEQGWTVRSLDNHRTRFVKHVETMLMRKGDQPLLGLFDETPPAQLMRLMSYDTWSGKLENTGKISGNVGKLVLKSGSNAKATAGTERTTSLATGKSEQAHSVSGNVGIASGSSTNQSAWGGKYKHTVEASYYPLNGEIDLFRLHIPEQPEQLVLQLKGQGQRGGLYTVELGAWSALLHAKAWGKAGAMLAASGRRRLTLPMVAFA